MGTITIKIRVDCYHGAWRYEGPDGKAEIELDILESSLPFIPWGDVCAGLVPAALEDLESKTGV